MHPITRLREYCRNSYHRRFWERHADLQVALKSFPRSYDEFPSEWNITVRKAIERPYRRDMDGMTKRWQTIDSILQKLQRRFVPWDDGSGWHIEKS